MRVLIVEDDPHIAELLRDGLTEDGYDCDLARSAAEGAELARLFPYGLLLLDVMLPEGIDAGYHLGQQLRAEGIAAPMIYLTARGTVEDRVEGLEAGGDDYLVKPFAFRELRARIRALLRRSAGHAKSELNCGSVRLDTRTGRVAVEGNPVKLTSHEYRLLSYLMHHAGRVVSRTELVEHLYDQDFDRDSNTIEVFVGRIRKKLGVDIIQTVRGLGYLLTPPNA